MSLILSFLERCFRAMCELLRLRPRVDATKALPVQEVVESEGLSPAQRYSRKPRHQDVAIFQQKYDYSCTASVLQSVHHHLTGEAMSHEEAIRLTECKPDGAQLSVIASALRSLTGARARKLRRMSEARRSLRAKRLVISCDNLSYCDPHAVLLVGSTRAGFYVLDPNTARITWRRDQWVKEAADEFIEVFPLGV